MKSVTKLKDDARKHEQKEEWDKAIQAYLLVLKTGEEGEGELDLPLYNRVGDLYLRVQKPNDAVRYYVQAADRYAEAGLFNNAIALCNKAMRYVPQQLDLLRKLGQFSASQGFLTDARRYFLEYAEKKFAAGQVDDALTALEEFAEASGDAEVREMLARQLHTHGRSDEAVDELKKAHALRLKNGDQAGADAVRNEIESIAPGTMSSSAAASPSAAPSYSAPAPTHAEPEDDFNFEIKAPGEETPAAEEQPADNLLSGFESTHAEAASADDLGDFQIQGFETTHAEPEVEDAGSFTLSGFETTAHEGADDLGLEQTSFEAPASSDAEQLSDLQLDETSFSAITDETHEDDGGGFDLPLLDESADETTEDAPLDDAFLSIDGDIGNAGDATGSLDLPTFDIDTSAAEGLTDDFAHDDSGAFELPTLDDDPDHHDAGDFGSFDLPMLTEDGPSETDALPSLEEETPAAADTFSGFTSSASSFDDEDFGEFGHPRSGAPGIEPDSEPDSEAITEPDITPFAEPEAAEDEDTAFLSEMISDSAAADAHSAEVAEAENASADFETTTPVEPVASSSEGGWDPSALGPAAATPSAPPPPAKSKPKNDGDYIDLGSFLTEDDDDDNGTRFRVQEKAPTGDEDRDFAELLSQFKQKVSENVSEEDSAAHYDLGLAFKEMGLVDEAISEFQIAMRAGDMRLRVYEELGQCFLLKDQFNIAEKVLTRALSMGKQDELEMIGVYYHLGRAYEGLGNRDAARDAYERVLGLDINFQDVSTRLKKL